jgi:C1A family cysteine protease
MTHPNVLIKSPQDDRDWVYEGLALAGPESFPKEFDLRPHLPPVRDQGSRGTCAAFTSCCIKEYHEKIDHPDNFKGYMSPDTVYFYRQNKPAEGMYCRDVMRILTKYGAGREMFQPYSSREPLTLSREAVKDAKRFKIKGYAQIHTINAAKKALMTSGPLLVAFPYYDNGKAEFWQPKGQMSGGHAVACVGWTEEGFIIRNSWSSNWNGDGYVIYNFADWGSHWELWSAVDEETQWTPPPQPQPRRRRTWFQRLRDLRLRRRRWRR